MLLAISVLVALGFFVAFVISVRKGQYEDTYTPSVRMLFEDELVDSPATDSTEENNQPINKN